MRETQPVVLVFKGEHNRSVSRNGRYPRGQCEDQPQAAGGTFSALVGLAIIDGSRDCLHPRSGDLASPRADAASGWRSRLRPVLTRRLIRH
jgi:hypothetical protein